MLKPNTHGRIEARVKRIIANALPPSFEKNVRQIVGEEDIMVRFIGDSNETIEINKSAVLCAAQLYHGMVVADELDVFGAVHYVATRHMSNFSGMRIQDKVLLEDLQGYVLQNRYIDFSNGRVERNSTRPAERRILYRHVFGEGTAEMPQDMSINGEFKQLWMVLMLESARYLERAQSSKNPENLLLRQHIMQAVANLQRNLSVNCSGMVAVISAALDAELQFVIRRILKHDDILRQVVPEGGTWKRVVDKLNDERGKQAGPATTLCDKATEGKSIIEMISGYTPAAFEDDETFSAFISKVVAYISAQSIIVNAEFDNMNPE